MNIPMDEIRGFTFAPFAERGMLASDGAKKSLQQMQERTGCSTVILVPAGLQETAHSTGIDWTGEKSMTDGELVSMIGYAKSLGLRVILKPTVNCLDGTWRAYISFFDTDVPCEPKWGDWFASYTAFQCHYADIAEACGCDMFLTGCEMVMTEHREREWRALLQEVRRHYHGPVGYNTDKYQEGNVTWWDAVDVMASSGYYPIGRWKEELARIEKTVRKFQKPFFFAESGCMSAKGSSLVPNDWTHAGAADPGEQAAWYEDALSAVSGADWCSGIAFWSWGPSLLNLQGDEADRSYEVYGKPAEKVVHHYFTQIMERNKS